MSTTDKTIVMRTPVMFSESYVKSFVARAIELGHIPSVEEFEYCEKENAATVENTTLMALSYTAVLHTDQHKAMMEMVSPIIRDTFKLFAEHGIVLSIYESYFANPTAEE